MAIPHEKRLSVIGMITEIKTKNFRAQIEQLQTETKEKDQMIEALEGDIVLLQTKLKDKE